MAGTYTPTSVANPLYQNPSGPVSPSNPLPTVQYDQPLKPGAIVASSSASRIDTGNNSVKLDTKIADNLLKTTEKDTTKETDSTVPVKTAKDVGLEGYTPGTGEGSIYTSGDGSKWTFTKNGWVQGEVKTNKTDSTTTPETPEDPYTKMMKDQQAKLDTQAAESKKFYDDLKIRQDATTAALIDSITKKYEARRAQMSDTNARMLEGKRISGISAGRQRYAGKMEQGLLSTEEMDGQARLAQLDGEELQLIAQAKQARDEASYKAFNDYMSQLDKNNADKMETITKMHQIAMDTDKALADKKKAEQQAVLDQTRLADSMAPSANLAYLSLKTPDEKAIFIKKLAERYNLPEEMVQSSMLKYADEATKADLDQQMKQEQIKTEKAQQSNYYSLIEDRDTNGTGSKEKPLVQAETMLESGAKLQDGTVFNGRGADGFVDPYLYIQIYNGWSTETEKVAFLKKFPPEDNINPEFPADELPQAIKVRLGL